LDNNEELAQFSKALEASVISTVEHGFMTKDLAICVAGTVDVAREQYLNTQDFLEKIN